MRTFLSFLLPTLAIIFVVLLAFVLVFAIVAGIAVGSGWLLRLVFNFTFFESSLLGALFTGVTLYILVALLQAFVPDEMMGRSTALMDDDSDGANYKAIPASRFYKSSTDKTWESWLTHEFANDIYVEFQDEPDTVANLNESQTKELAVRLAEIAIEMLKRKTARTRRYSITIANFKREMAKKGLRTYDDDILRLAVGAANLNMEYYSEQIREIIQTKGWDEPATMPEDA